MLARLRSPLGFAGGLHDWDTGLVRFGWRDYDPETGRFTAQDPIGAAGGAPDWYGYCLDDPINGRDPEGLETNATKPASLEFDPSTGRMIFRDDTGSYSYEARNDVVRGHTPIEDGAYVPDVTPQTIKKQPAYGPPGSYIDTGRKDQKDIHGGGSRCKDPYAARQEWRPTEGCIRMQNEDVQELSKKIKDYKKRTGNNVPFSTPNH
ncbi:MAG: RHS repeat-associated core domain-containing protein [Desulfovibrio sp.]